MTSIRSKPSDYAWGGAPAVALVGGVNSDIENGRIKPGAPPAQLNDLDADVNQTTNLYHQYPEVIQEMEALLRTYRLQRQLASKRCKNQRND